MAMPLSFVYLLKTKEYDTSVFAYKNKEHQF